MPKSNDNMELLIGLLALRLGFVDESELLETMRACHDDASGSLAETFVTRQVLSPEQVEVIRHIADAHVKKNKNSPSQSLSEIHSTLFSDDSNPQTVRDFLAVRESATLDPIHTVIEDDVHQTREHSTPLDSRARFRVLRPHAKGGLGQVSVARDNEINREVALKELQLRFASNDNIKGRFLMEAEITGALEHPGVAPVYGCGKYPDGRPYYAMRFIRGETLHHAIEQAHKNHSSKFVTPDSVEFRKLIQRFIDVCDTIQYAHSRGVVHRDIKPANIILGNYGETIVVDWGLAKQVGEQDALTQEPPLDLNPSESGVSPTTIGSVVGTPGYMSPEQATGRHDLVGKQSDVYSLGATLYHMLTGTSAFGDNSTEILGHVSKGGFPDPREINREIPVPLEAICLKAMKRKPANRYESVFHLAEDLQMWMAGEKISAVRESVFERFARWRRNHQTLVMSVGAATAVALVGMSVSLVLLQSAYNREQAGFLETRKTVDEYFTLVSEEALLDQPGFQPLRQKLLIQARYHYQRFVKERHDDSQLNSELGLARYRLGQITEIVDSPADAIAEFQAAISIQQALDSNSSVNQQRLGTSLNALGRALHKSSRFDESLVALERAVQVRQQLADWKSGNIEYQRQLANTFMNLGTLYRIKEDITKAVSYYHDSQDVRRTALEGIGPDADYNLRRDLGKGYYNLANISASQNDIPVSRSNFERAIDEFETLLERRSNDQVIQSLLAISYRRLGDVQIDESPDIALSLYSKSLAIIEPLARFNSDVHDYQTMNAGILNNLASARLRMGDFHEASKRYQLAVEIYRRQYAQSSLETAGFHDYANTLLNLARLYLMAKPHTPSVELDEAVVCLDEAVNLFQKQGDRFAMATKLVIVDSFAELSRVRFAEGNWDGAYGALDNALRVLNEASIGNRQDKSVLAKRLNILAEARSSLEFFKRQQSERTDEHKQRMIKKFEGPIQNQLTKNLDQATLQFDGTKRLVELANLMRLAHEFDSAVAACQAAEDVLTDMTLKFENDGVVRQLHAQQVLVLASIRLAQASSPEVPIKERTELVAKAKQKLAEAIRLDSTHESIAHIQRAISEWSNPSQ